MSPDARPRVARAFAPVAVRPLPSTAAASGTFTCTSVLVRRHSATLAQLDDLYLEDAECGRLAAVVLLGGFTGRSRMTDTSASQATLKENKAVIRRFVEEVQNGKSEDAYWELNDPDFVNLAPLPPGVPSDREGGFAYLFGFMNAFPDSRVTIEDMIAEGDQVVTKKTFTGTHTGEFAGIPPTGKPVTLQFVDIMRVRDGKIVEHWNCIDQLSFMQQLGVIPTQS
jgi:steroid delta-isomerase-like uncharacterized protein